MGQEGSRDKAIDAFLCVDFKIAIQTGVAGHWRSWMGRLIGQKITQLKLTRVLAVVFNSGSLLIAPQDTVSP
jgi:hypothetical protein